MFQIEENPWEGVVFQKLKSTLAPTPPQITTTTAEKIIFEEEVCCFKMIIEPVDGDKFGQEGEYNLKKAAIEGQLVFYKVGSGNYLSFERNARKWSLFVRNHGMFYRKGSEGCLNCSKNSFIRPEKALIARQIVRKEWR